MSIILFKHTRFSCFYFGGLEELLYVYLSIIYLCSKLGIAYSWNIICFIRFFVYICSLLVNFLCLAAWMNSCSCHIFF